MSSDSTGPDQRELLRLRDALAGAQAERAEHRARQNTAVIHQSARDRWEHLTNQEHVVAQRDDALRQLAEIRASASWRIGNTIVRVLTFWRRNPTP